ncbi:organic cation/carnitine transporter 7 [Ricinus communis]|uniref:Sugar transporter, putative n=1 Tax=Ricinus communis TaxID=3988 RepID=B9SPX0_RICCO|nr:organic cation/carnitine transporter 7 [Ricinus communis]EEF34357.1 sugar transporter, putative [Ricinus communis]|eukprot:XP_002528039.1 organic cation/carnitine transporter 7 [Ricinus communis]
MKMEYESQNLVYNLDEALAAVGFGKFQGFVLVYAGLGWFSEAMEVMILSFVGPAVKLKWELSSTQESLLSTVVFGGMLIGACTWGLISDNYGRRKCVLSITVITSGAGFISAFSPNYLTLVVLRCLVGFGLGGTHVFLSWFLEFIPTSHRGKWMVIFSTFWTLGIIFEASLAWIVMLRLNWRWLLALSTVPSFSLLLFYGLVPESPRYLCLKGRTAQAHQVLEKIALVNQKELPPGMLVSYGKIKEDEEISALEQKRSLLFMDREKISTLKSGFSSFSLLFSSNLIQTTLLLWVLFFGNVFSYYGIILLTSQLSSSESKCSLTILHSQNPQDESLFMDVLITSFAELPGILLSAMMVDRFGRKLSMAIMFIFAWIFLLPLVSRQSDILTTGLLFGARMFSLGTFTVASIYAPELYPTSIRSTGAGTASAVGRIGGMVCPLVAVALVSNCHFKAAIILFEVVIAITVVCILLFPFETSGRELSDRLAAPESKQDLVGY